MSKNQGVDKIFLFSVIALLAIGFTTFISASMGMLATNSTQFSSVIFKQGFFGILLGLVVCFIFSRIPYKFFRKYALFIFIFSLLVTLLVFVPHVGSSLNTFAKRWILIGGLTFQPVALLNIGFIIYWASWLSYVKDKASNIQQGLFPLMIILVVIGAILIKQPDNASFSIICMTGMTMFLVAGGKFRHIMVIGIIGALCLAVLAFTRPYVMSRIDTFLNPGENAQTSGYQVQQSLIAIGSGQFFGRGLGQSIQKYKFLPVSVSDSIFAVFGEELGFIGCISVIGLFLFFLFRSFRIAIQAPDAFGGLLVVGIVTLIVVQSFMNISSTLGIIPFSGIPLAFFSQGGTSMLMMLAQIGIVLNVSKFAKA